MKKKRFEIVNRHFNNQSKLYKLINKNKLKPSYSCMTNIPHIIRNYDNKIIKTNCKKSEENCNCRKKLPYERWKMQEAQHNLKS